MMNFQPGLQMRKLTGSCSWAGTTQPDSTWTLERERGRERDTQGARTVSMCAQIYAQASRSGNVLI